MKNSYIYGGGDGSDIMTDAGSTELVWDHNGRLTNIGDRTFIYNPQGKLREVRDGSDQPIIKLKYDPMGNRVYKWSANGGNPIERKYIVDISGNLSTILTEMDPNDPNDSLKNTYIYDSGGNILAQRYYSDPGDPDYYEQFFYVADRLGSVRLVIDANGDAANSYSYNPFGLDLADQCVEDPNVPNPFKFTGQWFDEEIGQYYLRARMYDPALMRFTDRDPVKGKPKEPLTLHPYLYCANDSVNRVDPSGEISAASLASGVVTGYSLYGHGLALATYAASNDDEQFWALSRLTFASIPFAITVAALNYFGPATNLLTVAHIVGGESVYGPTTGLTAVQGLAIDPFAYTLYYIAMGTAQRHLGIDANDMQNFIDWMAD